MEYGGVQFMGADITHLKKLDSVQAAAEKIGRFTVETLASRREASAVAFSAFHSQTSGWQRSQCFEKTTCP